MGASSRQGFFDAHASGWEERNYSPETLHRLQEMIRGLHFMPGARVLDVGCGTGVLFPYLREAIGPEGRLLALDSSAEMLKWAVQKRSGATVVLQAPAEALPLIDVYLDAIICFAAFPHFSDKGRVAREFYRTLQPGGRAYVAHLGTRDEISTHHHQYAPVAGDRIPAPDAMTALFTAAGFGRTSLEERPGWYLFTAEKETAR